MNRCLVNFDLFASVLGMNYFGERRITSKVTMAFSLIIFLLTILAIIDFSSNFVHKTNPIITKSEKYFFSNKLIMSRKDENFQIGLNLVFANGTFLSDSSKLYVYMSYTYYNESVANYSDTRTKENLFSLYEFGGCEVYFQEKDVFNGYSNKDIPALKTSKCFDVKKSKLLDGTPVDDLILEGDSLRHFNRVANVIISLCPYNPQGRFFNFHLMDFRRKS